MKKPAPRLVVRRETLRVLTTLDLVRAAGGFDTGKIDCPGYMLPIVAKPPGG